MRVPTSIQGTRGGGERRQRDRSRGEQSAGGSRLRPVLVAATLLALSYLVWRRMRSGERGDEATADAIDRGEGQTVPIDEPTDDAAASEEADETASAVDPSLEEVDYRVDEDVEETPVGPGEMTVSEDVAEEAGEATNEDESGGEAAGESAGDSEAEETDESEE